YRGADRLRATASFSSCRREHRSAARPARRRRARRAAGRRSECLAALGLHDGAGGARALVAADGGAGVAVLLVTRPQPAGRRVHRRSGARDRGYRAVHGRRCVVGRGAHAHSTAVLDRRRVARGGQRRCCRLVRRQHVPDEPHVRPALAVDRHRAPVQHALVRHRRVHARGRCDGPDARRTGAPVVAQLSQARGRLGSSRGRAHRAAPRAGGAALMEVVFALAVGVLAGSGVWLLLRPRTFQVIMGLALLSYAINLFIFAMGRLAIDRAPILNPGDRIDPALYADPVPQALVLTAIVISFATTALLLVVILAARGLTGTDHVDGREGEA